MRCVLLVLFIPLFLIKERKTSTPKSSTAAAETPISNSISLIPDNSSSPNSYRSQTTTTSSLQSEPFTEVSGGVKQGGRSSHFDEMTVRGNTNSNENRTEQHLPTSTSFFSTMHASDEQLHRRVALPFAQRLRRRSLLRPRNDPNPQSVFVSHCKSHSHSDHPSIHLTCVAVNVFMCVSQSSHDDETAEKTWAWQRIRSFRKKS